MALPNLTNQNIQDTYQRVVQTDGTKIYDGTGSLLPLEFDGNNVIISGSLTAQTYVVSESIVAVTSGSTMFGNSSDDTHTFEGAITASGDVSSSGVITATQYKLWGDTTLATRHGSGEIDLGDTDDIIEIHGTNIKLSAPITASGDISASGEIYGKGFHVPANINDGYHIGDGKPILAINGEGGYLSLGAGHPTYNAAGVKIFTTGSDENAGLFLDSVGNVTSSGNISSSGDINANQYSIQGKTLTTFVSDTLRHGFDSSLTNYTYGKDSDNEHLFYGNVTSSGYGVVSASSISNIARYNSTINYLTYGDAANKMYIYADDHVVIPSARLIVGGTTTGTSDFKVNGHSVFTGAITSSGNISSSGNLYIDQHITNKNGLLAWEFFTANNFSNTDTISWYNGSKIYFSNNPTQIQGNLTASGNISSSGDIVFFGGHVTASNNISASGTVFGITGSFPHIITDGDTIEFRNKSTRAVEGFLKFDTTEGLQVLDDSRNVKPNKPGLRLFKTGSHETAGTTAEGDIVRFGNSTTVAGDIYALLPDGTWTQADKRENNTTCSLAAAVGTNSTTHGMLLRGMVKLDHDPDCQIGHPLYLATVGHAGCDSAAADQYARVVGSYMSGSGTVYFNPDNTWVKRSS